MINEKIICDCEPLDLQRSLSVPVNGGPDATTDRWKQPFSAVRASGVCPGNVEIRQYIYQGPVSI